MRKAIWAVICLLLFGCVGGKSTTVSGVAATGEPVSGKISLKDAIGHEVALSTTDGKFAFEVSTLSPPFMLKATWNGNTMYSFAATTGTTNITPLTQMVVAAAAGSSNLDALYRTPSPAAFNSIATNLPTATASIRNSLKPLLTAYNADMNPISGAFSANGSGMDALLDRISVTCDSATLSVLDRASGATLFTASASPTLNNAVSAMGWSNEAAAIAQDPDLQVSQSGDRLAVWWKAASPANGAGVIQAQWLGSEASATQISSATGFATAPKAAIDAAGNAIVVWMQSEEQITDVWVNRYGVGAGWGVPRRLTHAASPAIAPSGTPSIAMDAAGNAVVMWNESNAAISGHFDVYTARYAVVSDSWSSPTLLSNGANSAYGYKVAANSSGKVAVIYAQFRRIDGVGGNGDASDIWVATGAATGDLADRARVSSSANLMYGQASLAVGPAGSLVAAWIQNNDSGYLDVWISRQAAGGGWDTPRTIANSVTGACYFPEVAIDASDNAWATWQQQSDPESRQYVAASRCAAGGSWSPKTEISQNIGSAYDHHLAVDSSGTATELWYQVQSSVVTVSSARYSMGSGWSAPRLFSTLGAGYGGVVFPAPRVAANNWKTFIIWGTSSN